MRKFVIIIMLLTIQCSQLLAQPNYQDQMRATGKPGHNHPFREYCGAALEFTGLSAVNFGYIRPNFKGADFGLDSRNGFTAGTSIVLPFMNPYNLERGMDAMGQLLANFSLKVCLNYSHSKITFADKSILKANSLEIAPLMGSTLLMAGPYFSHYFSCNIDGRSALSANPVFSMPGNDFGLRLSTRLIFINVEFSWGLKDLDFTKGNAPLSGHTRCFTIKYEI